jgi:two-component sensor histidine kinase
MAFHELATNAAKYGSLSRKGGSVAVNWTVEQAPPRLCVEWAEQGGPAVKPPTRSGFGRLLLERALAADLHGEVALEFAADGVRCRLAVPLEDRQASDTTIAA